MKKNEMDEAFDRLRKEVFGPGDYSKPNKKSDDEELGPTEFDKKLAQAKMFAYNGISKTVKILNHKVVKNTTSFAKDVLDITDKVKNGNLLSKTAAIVASVESVATLLNVPKPDPVKDYIQDYNLMYTDDGQLFELLLNKAVFSKVPHEIVSENSSQALVKMSFDEENFVCFLKAKKDKNDVEDGEPVDLSQSAYYSAYYLPRNFDVGVVYKMFWDLYDNKIFLSTKRDKVHGPIRGFKFNLENVFLDKAENERIGKEISICKKKEISRSYLLVGEPGLGKTTRCFAACQSFCPRVLKVDSSAIDGLGVGELETHILNFKPDAIILDDIDRSGSTKTGYLLFTLENIKTTFPSMVLFATANYFENLDKAVVRPGRFDRIIWIEPPTKDDRKFLIESFIKAYDTSVDEETLEKLATETDGFSHAYIKELVLRISNSEDTIVTIDEALVEFKRTLNLRGEIPDTDYSVED